MAQPTRRKKHAVSSSGVGGGALKTCNALVWVPNLDQNEPADPECCTVRKLDGGNSWTAGTPLPKRGRFSWRCRIDHSAGNSGALLIGIVDHAGTTAFVLAPSTGMLYGLELRTDVHGQRADLDFDASSTQSGIRVLTDMHGEPCKLRGRAVGKIVEVIVDLDRGAIAFRTGAAEQFAMLANIPLEQQGLHLLPWAVGLPIEPMRPCVGLWRTGDQVTLLSRGLNSLEGLKLQGRRNRARERRDQRQRDLHALTTTTRTGTRGRGTAATRVRV